MEALGTEFAAPRQRSCVVSVGVRWTALGGDIRIWMSQKEDDHPNQKVPDTHTLGVHHVERSKLCPPQGAQSGSWTFRAIAGAYGASP